MRFQIYHWLPIVICRLLRKLLTVAEDMEFLENEIGLLRTGVAIFLNQVRSIVIGFLYLSLISSKILLFNFLYLSGLFIL